jgi:hypothetical protein
VLDEGRVRTPSLDVKITEKLCGTIIAFPAVMA